MNGGCHSPDLGRHAQLWDVLRRPVWVFDPHRLCGLYANPAALKLWGADGLEELLSRDFSQLSPAARARTARLAEATLGGEEIAERWTFYPNGRPVTVQATISTLWIDDHRAVLLFEASSLEVGPEERRAVEALRHASALITLFDEGGRPAFSNPAAFSAYGLIPAHFEARFRDQGLARALLIQALAGETVSDVFSMVTMAGDRWHHLDARKVLDPVTGQPGVLLNEIDVSQRVHAQQAWAAAEQKAVLAGAREKFLSDMSHDLRTPLNAVIGFSAVLAKGELNPKQTDQVARIHQSGKLLLAVVEDMITFSETDMSITEGAVTLSAIEASGDSLEDFAGVLADRPLRILYVDDNANNRALVTAILTAQGIQCQTADDGSEGYEAAKADPWDMILMDIQMPVMDGVEATRAIRASGGQAQSIPIIAVTANTLPNQLENYRNAGMNDCINKPIEISVLLQKIDIWSSAYLDDETPMLARTA